MPHDAVKPVCHIIRLAVCLDVRNHIHSELVESKVGYGDASVNVFEVLQIAFLQLFQLFLAVVEVGLLARYYIVVACCRRIDKRHSVLHAGVKVDIFVQRYVRPKIDKLDIFIFASYSVYSAEPLHYPDRVPMDVVIDTDVAVLQVLSFAYTIRRNQYVNVNVFVRRVCDVSLFRHGRKQRKQSVCFFIPANVGRVAAVRALYSCAVQTVFFQ